MFFLTVHSVQFALYLHNIWLFLLQKWNICGVHGRKFNCIHYTKKISPPIPLQMSTPNLCPLHVNLWEQSLPVWNAVCPVDKAPGNCWSTERNDPRPLWQTLWWSGERRKKWSKRIKHLSYNEMTCHCVHHHQSHQSTCRILYMLLICGRPPQSGSKVGPGWFSVFYKFWKNTV